MKNSFNQWLIDKYGISEHKLTIEWIYSRYECYDSNDGSKEEMAQGLMDNICDEYGDYLNK